MLCSFFNLCITSVSCKCVFLRLGFMVVVFMINGIDGLCSLRSDEYWFFNSILLVCNVSSD